MKKITFLMLFFLPVILMTGQENTSLDQYITERFIDANGDEVVKILVPGKPPDHFRMPAVVPSNAVTAYSLANVPAYDWSFGCSATSAAMMAGYYDRTGYANMYAGPTSGGVAPMDNSVWGTIVINGETRSQCPFSATRNGLDGRTIRGHVDDYWILYNNPGPDPFIVNGWTEHTYGECTGDYMKTNQSNYSNVDGSTWFYNYSSGAPYSGPGNYNDDGMYGINLFFQSRGYTVTSYFNQYIYGYNGNTLGFTFTQYKAQIDAGRPVLIQVDGHTMLGMGYNDTGSLVYLHDTWDYSTHQMTWGGSYSGMAHYGVGVIQLQATAPEPCSNITSITSCGSGYPQTYTGGGSGAWYTATANPCGYVTPGLEKVYSFVAPYTGTYSIQVTAASGYVDYLWKTSSCSSTGWTCIDDINTTGQYGAMAWTAGTTYYILLDDEDNTAGTHTFYINCPICYGCPSYNFSISPTTSWQTHSSSHVAYGCKMYRVSVTSGQQYIFKSGCGNGATANYNTYFELYNSSCSLVASDDDGCESSRSTISWTATYTGYAYLKVRGVGSASGSYTLAYINYFIPANRMVQNVTIPSGQSNCYDATQNVITAGSGTTFIVQSGGEASLIAGYSVLMLPGTLAQSGCYLLASITTNGSYCYTQAGPGQEPPVKVIELIPGVMAIPLTGTGNSDKEKGIGNNE
jgi:hypothetical protein